MMSTDIDVEKIVNHADETKKHQTMQKRLPVGVDM